ncbi:MAG: hypothetical protein ACP5HZ_01575 [Ferrimicrobium sp.]
MVILDTMAVQFARARLSYIPPLNHQWIADSYNAVPGVVLLSGECEEFDMARAGMTIFVLESALPRVIPALGLLVAARSIQGIGAAFAALWWHLFPGLSPIASSRRRANLRFDLLPGYRNPPRHPSNRQCHAATDTGDTLPLSVET